MKKVLLKRSINNGLNQSIVSLMVLLQQNKRNKKKRNQRKKLKSRIIKKTHKRIKTKIIRDHSNKKRMNCLNKLDKYYNFMNKNILNTI